MDWKDFFQMTILRETLQGPHRYFQADLRIQEEFSIDELLMREFEYLDLTERERKLFSLNVRKTFLRHKCFKSAEFDRIVENFTERLSTEKEQLLTFSTSGGGVYLFMAMLKNSPAFLKEKRLICYTSELPLDIMKTNQDAQTDVHFILRPHAKSVFKDFPTLWQKSNVIDLFEVNEA
jgi:hypothetical protein